MGSTRRCPRLTRKAGSLDSGRRSLGGIRDSPPCRVPRARVSSAIRPAREPGRIPHYWVTERGRCTPEVLGRDLTCALDRTENEGTRLVPRLLRVAASRLLNDPVGLVAARQPDDATAEARARQPRADRAGRAERLDKLSSSGVETPKSSRRLGGSRRAAARAPQYRLPERPAASTTRAFSETRGEPARRRRPARTLRPGARPGRVEPPPPRRPYALGVLAVDERARHARVHDQPGEPRRQWIGLISSERQSIRSAWLWTPATDVS